MIQILRHEADFFADKHLGIQGERARNAEDIREAVGPAYDWHDNGGFDEAGRERARIEARLADVLKILDGEIVGYPDENDPAIRLGSMVVGSASFGQFRFLLTGTSSFELIQQYANAWAAENDGDEDISAVTPVDGLGRAVLGATVGSSVEYTDARKRSQTFTIESIDQTWLRDHFDPSRVAVTAEPESAAAFDVAAVAQPLAEPN